MASGEMVFLNGELVPYGEAKISVEDRGFNFADGLYEVTRIVGGRPFRVEDHLDRLEAGARSLEIEIPSTRADLLEAITSVAAANGIGEGIVYLRLTRGPAPRGHAFPEAPNPTLVMLARPLAAPSREDYEAGVAVVTAPDLRWGYCEVKTIGLLPNVLAFQRARSEGGFEAVLVRDGIVTEGSHTSVFCVRGDKVYTHPVDNILPGITRRYLIEVLRSEDVEVVELGIPVDEFRRADEIFLTGTTTAVLPVTRLDGDAVGSGRPGEITRLGIELYRRDLEEARKRAGS